MTRLWIVRTGAHGERELEVITEGRLMLDFNEVGDLTGLKDRDAITRTVREAIPSAGENTIRNFSAQLNQFVNAIAEGDLVVMSRKVTSGVAIGEVAGPYVFVPDGVR